MTQVVDKDLISIQETRDLLRKAKVAQQKLGKMNQNEIDRICKAIKDVALQHADRLAKLAVEETGFGIHEDKIIKNYFASQVVYDSIRDMKTVGVVNEDNEKKVFEVAVPVGVIAGLIPSTNPTSTVIYKALISIKAGNAIVLSPHPSAKNCIIETARVIIDAAEAAGMPKGCIGCVMEISMAGTDELLKNNMTKLILATGGEAMVKAAYSSGNPAIGVGPGNGPAFIEKSADFSQAVSHIIESKTFDNGTICASEQSIIVEKESEVAVLTELRKQGCYVLNDEEKERLDQILLSPKMTMNPKTVGKDAAYIAKMADIDVPIHTKVLIGKETNVGYKVPLSREKLCPVLGFYVADDWRKACERAIEILDNEGAGHTMILHSHNEDLIKEFALEKQVSRLLINTPGALGGIGGTTGIAPALTLGCGAIGGSATSDNITPMNLLNLRRVAYGIRELASIRSKVNTELNVEPIQMETTDVSYDLDEITNIIINKLKKENILKYKEEI
ncbi:acetaldehyde dehydrogenase (acetylating) [Alkalibaculum sp. M08DMB]|uniref:Acetaldehyde dehydrogenase (Acetylating) n=1 Tax=Alkalibaculum sporogenes TaxID=2655001 RepID=A0A6A7K7R1_9FIRM|nr:acetaldehyde dehydrogenase (acetylating) [Alkalibaculum sporogenes]MPW25528.1 acetaldehyde dehydrogenase (acetylating) [Alkalibaculum sporogenes]